jgi:hypothetical protein
LLLSLNLKRYILKKNFDTNAFGFTKIQRKRRTNTMRVEAIVKKGGWFIPHPGVAIGNQKHILLDITPVTTAEVEDDAFVQAAGMLKKAANVG